MGHPRESDKRVYGTLEELLRPTWGEPEEATAGSPEGPEDPMTPKRLTLEPGGARRSVWESLRMSQEMAQVSSDWSAMLELAAKMPSASSSSKVPVGEEHVNVENMAEEIAAVKRMTMLGMGGGAGQRMAGSAVLDAPPPTERPPSPLKPGVYVGRHGKQNVPVFPRTLAPLRGLLPADASAEAAAASGPQPIIAGASQPRPPTKAAKLRQRTQVWANVQNMLAQDDTDEHLASEREQYNLWKKKVIESARALQLEVSRFHTSAS